MKVKLPVPPLGHIRDGRIKNDITQSFNKAMFDQRENQDNTICFQQEQHLLNSVQRGDITAIRVLIEENKKIEFYMGSFSNNMLRQAQYAFVSAVTLITRSAIQGGMPEMNAYNLSDVYIQKMDTLTDTDAITTLFISSLFDFTKRVQQTKFTRHSYSKPIATSLSYINNHLHSELTLNVIAENAQISATYLSTLFKKETGQSLTDYILESKLETSMHMLLFSDYGISEIASHLSFCSHSNFTHHFKKRYGITPKVYRDKHKALIKK